MIPNNKLKTFALFLKDGLIQIIIPTIAFTIVTTSCNQNKNNELQEKKSPIVIKDSSEKIAFMPVTDIINGELNKIKQTRNPKKYVIEKNKKDSSWVTIENVNAEFSEFLTPVIDSLNLVPYFTESRFNDLTLNKITLDYAPKKDLPQNISVKHWIVYINNENYTIEKIYIEKQLTPQKKVQLTWNNGKNCRMVYLVEDEKNNFTIEKTIELKWDY